MRSFLPLFAGAVLNAACLLTAPAETPAPDVKSEALVVTRQSTVAPPSPVGPAAEDQREPAVATGPRGDQVVLWRDLRNARWRGSDVYASRLVDGGASDPLGLPLASGPGEETEPSLAFDGTAYTATWSQDNQVVMATRFASPLDATASQVVVAVDGHHPRVAAGGGHTLVSYRFNIGQPFGLLLEPDGGRRALDDGGTILDFRQPPVSWYPGPMVATWSEAHQAFFVLISDGARGLFLERVDPAARDGGWLAPGPAVQVASTPFPNDTFFTSGVDLAAAPGGALAATWRVHGNTWAVLMSQPPTAALDGGALLSSTSNGAPSVTWTGTSFRVAVSTASAGELYRLSLDGGLAADGTLPASAGTNACQTCPPIVVEGDTVVSTTQAAGAGGADLLVDQRPEGSGGGPPGLLTRSAGASHTPVAAWTGDGGSALLAWVSRVDGGVVLSDVMVRQYNPATGSLGAIKTADGDSTVEDYAPRLAWSAGRWWLGTVLNKPGWGEHATMATSAESPLAFSTVFSDFGNSPAVFAPGWVVASNRNEVDFRTVLPDGGLGAPSHLAYTSAWFPEVAVDALGRPLVVSVSRPGSGENTWVASPGVTSVPQLTAAAGTPRHADVAGDGVAFAAVYTQRAGTQVALIRANLGFAPDGGVAVLDGGAELARATYIDTPSIVLAQGQYLVAWSERSDVREPTHLRMRTLRLEGGAGAEVPLPFAPTTSDLEAHLALNPAQDKALLTWTRLDAPGLGAPTAYVAQFTPGLGLGASCLTAAECSSGSCADGVCCDGPCSGGCGRCSALGTCLPLAFTQECRPLQGECDLDPEFCDGTALVCPSDTSTTEGNVCASGSGACHAGACVVSAVDAGTVDAGTVDAGTVDAGTVDAGTVDAGTVDAGAVDAGTVDAGSVDAGSTAPVDGGADEVGGVSHYSWSQGCGCQATGNPAGLVLLLLPWLRRRQGGRR